MHAQAEVGLDAIDREVERAINDLGIPPCPAVLTRLMQEVRSDEPDFKRVELLVGADVGLAAALLQTANSPLYGLRTKAASIQHALAVLGLRNVAQLVVGLLLRQAFPVSGSKAMERFWETSSRVALVAARIAGEARIDRHAAHTFALFRDCGMPVMLKKYPAYEGILDGSAVPAGALITEAEVERCGLDHVRVGHYLAKSWELPEATCIAIRHHHDYHAWPALDHGAASLAALALAAEEVASRLAHRVSCTEWTHGAEATLIQLDIADAKLDEWAELVRAGISGR
jgi:HD-like signal output (HDOD) protein